MTASIIVCVLMTFLILFFIPLMNSFSLTSVLYALFLMFLFYRMTFAERKEKGSGVIYRRIFQVVFAVGFCIAFIADLYAERGSMTITDNAMSSSELPFCHIAIPQILVPFLITKSIIFPARITGHYAAVSSMLVIWLICTITVGRGWCSWICFYGGWEEGFSHLGKKRRLNLLPKNRELREFQFGFFAFILLASLCELACVYCEWFCPFKLVTEFSPITSIPGLIAAVMFIGLFLGLVVVLPVLTRRRVQCSTLCPFGAFASLTDGISLFKMKIDTDKCKGCMKCASACSFGAIDIRTIQEKKGRPELTCAKCGECVKACPEKAISYAFRFDHSCGCQSASATKRGKVLQELLDPAMLFRFAAFSFSVIMSSGFMIKALNLLLGVLVK
ncbi:MAG: 4Fe-4S binding protein [Treponemataceae bacterium]|nr:4Fe-4S binding protein [Treponemataceae bacterium]